MSGELVVRDDKVGGGVGAALAALEHDLAEVDHGEPVAVEGTREAREGGEWLDAAAAPGGGADGGAAGLDVEGEAVLARARSGRRRW
jgi:hypothetical protein